MALIQLKGSNAMWFFGSAWSFQALQQLHAGSSSCSELYPGDIPILIGYAIHACMFTFHPNVSQASS